MGSRKFRVVEKEIDGVVYKAQFNGMREALEAVDSCTIGEKVSSLKLVDYLLENVIVEPKGLNVDDFEDIEQLNRVVEFGREVMYGRFPKEGGQAKADTAGEE